MSGLGVAVVFGCSENRNVERGEDVDSMGKLGQHAFIQNRPEHLLRYDLVPLPSCPRFRGFLRFGRVLEQVKREPFPHLPAVELASESIVGYQIPILRVDRTYRHCLTEVVPKLAQSAIKPRRSEASLIMGIAPHYGQRHFLLPIASKASHAAQLFRMIVIGRYPHYIELGERLKAKVFNIPT